MGYWSEFDLRSALQNKSSPSLCPERSCRLKKRRAHLATAADPRNETKERRKEERSGEREKAFKKRLPAAVHPCIEETSLAQIMNSCFKLPISTNLPGIRYLHEVDLGNWSLMLIKAASPPVTRSRRVGHTANAAWNRPTLISLPIRS